MSLGVIWFILVGVLLAGYAIFDGFDLGVGVLYPFLGKTEQDKAIMRRAVGPVWDGNEVWLLTAGGALFAAFPNVYATVFSGFYLALMVLLFALIFRAAAFEFRAVDPDWAKFWDWALFFGSAIPALLFGVAVGNIIRGVPLTESGEMIAGLGAPIFGGNLLAAVNPYGLLIGLVSLAWMVLQGASWLSVKTTGDLYERSLKARRNWLVIFVVLFILATFATMLLAPASFARGISHPTTWIFLVVVIGGAATTLFAGSRADDRIAFYGSSLAAVGMVGIWASSIFPNLVPALSGSPGKALTVMNAASSQLSLTVMLIIAAIGVPLVLFYFFLIYRTYAGRIEPAVNADDGHY